MTESERQQTIKWLSRARYIDYDIFTLRAELNELNSQKFALGGNPSAEKVQKSSSGTAAYTSIVNTIADREAEIRRQIALRRETKNEIGQIIDLVENHLIAAILRAYYVNCQPIRVIAESISYSEKQTRRLKDRGVELVFCFLKPTGILDNE